MLVNSKVTIAGNEVSLGNSVDANTLRTSLGLSNALHFIGIATVAIADNSTTDPGISNYSTKTAGDVVIDKDSAYEYVWTGSKWERLGGDSSYKTVQEAVSDPSYAGSDTATTFVSGISQDINGKITITKRKLPTYNNYSHPTTSGNKHIPSGGSSEQFLGWYADGTAKWVNNPNTDTKQKITSSATTKAYITGVDATSTLGTALEGLADTGVYLTETAGEVSAVRHSFNISGTEKAYMTFNTTTNAIDFIFV